MTTPGRERVPRYSSLEASSPEEPDAKFALSCFLDFFNSAGAGGSRKRPIAFQAHMAKLDATPTHAPEEVEALRAAQLSRVAAWTATEPPPAPVEDATTDSESDAA